MGRQGQTGGEGKEEGEKWFREDSASLWSAIQPLVPFFVFHLFKRDGAVGERWLELWPGLTCHLKFEVSSWVGEGNGNPLQYSCLEKSHGWRNLVGYSPWGHKESDMTERLHFHELHDSKRSQRMKDQWELGGLGPLSRNSRQIPHSLPFS